jgi:hypothetical protein
MDETLGTSRSARGRTGAACAAALLAASVGVGTAAGAPPTYEPLRVLKASDFIDPDLLKGPNWEVDDRVVNDGLFNTYTIRTEWGEFQPGSTNLALIRIHEMGAIAKLKDVDKIAIAAGAAVDSVARMGKGTYELLTRPGEAAENIGGAASRLFGRIKRGIRRGQEKVEAGGTPDQSTASKVATAGGGAARDLLGVNRAMRNWAAKLYVDPYTHNLVLRDELEEVADYDAGGRFSTKLLPLGVVGTVLGSASTVNKLIWMKEPDELQTLNETRLDAMGVKPEDSVAFRLNKAYTLAVQTRLVASLDALEGATGRPEFVAGAATAEWEVDARFYQESAYMAELFHKTESPVIGLLPDVIGACALAKGDRLACLYPIDYMVWTQSVEGYVDRGTRLAKERYPHAKRELWLTGTVSERSKKELRKRGWAVHEKGMAVLPVLEPQTPPETTPTPEPAEATPQATPSQ